MANLDMAQSVLPKSLLRLSDIFAGQNSRYAHYKYTKAEYARLINQRQTARMNDIMSGGKCLGVDVTFLKKCTPRKGFACETITVEYPNCDVPLGTPIQSDKVTYDPKCLMHEARYVNDELCDNEYNAEELFAESIAEAVKDLDIRVNQYMIAQVAARAQANVDPFVGDYGTVVGTRVDINAANWTPDLLVQLETNAAYNGLGNYVIMDTRNLLTQRELAGYRSLNDNERNQRAQFAAYDDKLFFDNPFDTNVVLGRQSTFFIDMDMVAFVNRTSHTSQTPMLKDYSRNLHHFYVVSPLTGIRYDVDYQFGCNADRDALGNRAYTHKFDVKLIGGVVFAPLQCDNGSGILEFARV